MSENLQCMVFCSCVSLLRMMVSSFINVPAKDMNSSFFNGCILFHGVYVPHFLYPVYPCWAFGLVPNLCYCKLLQWTCVCICLYNEMIYNPLGIYPVRGLLDQMEFLFTRPINILKKCSSLFIREMQIKTALRYYLMPVRMVIIKKIRRQQMPQRMWRNRNAFTLLVGV